MRISQALDFAAPNLDDQVLPFGNGLTRLLLDQCAETMRALKAKHCSAENQ
jgi:hypothetical protein